MTLEDRIQVFIIMYSIACITNASPVVQNSTVRCSKEELSWDKE